MDLNILAYIPARGGSKRLPGKNIKCLSGKPLIHYSIDTAIASQAFGKIVVSTDDTQIAEVAQAAGAAVPWLRPAALASDQSSVVDAMQFDLQQLAEQGEQFDAVMLLQPTSPFRRVASIQQAIDMYQGDSVISVSPVREHPYWMKTIDDNGVIQPLFADQTEPQQAQQLPPVYGLNGLIYLTSCQTVLTQHTLYSPRARALIIDNAQEALDIDTADDWWLAEQWIKKIKQEAA